MKKKALQASFSIIIFLIIILVLVALILIWNFSGIGTFSKIFGSAGEVINATSGGAVQTLVP